jgi:hypothetical protein
MAAAESALRESVVLHVGGRAAASYTSGDASVTRAGIRKCPPGDTGGSVATKRLFSGHPSPACLVEAGRCQGSGSL